MRARVVTIILQMKKLRRVKIVTGLKTQLDNDGAMIQIQVGLAPEHSALIAVDMKGCEAEKMELGSHFLLMAAL